MNYPVPVPRQPPPPPPPSDDIEFERTPGAKKPPKQPKVPNKAPLGGFKGNLYALAIIYGIDWVRQQVAGVIAHDRELQRELAEAEKRYARAKAATEAEKRKRAATAEAARARAEGAISEARAREIAREAARQAVILSTPLEDIRVTAKRIPPPAPVPPPAKTYLGVTLKQWASLAGLAVPYLFKSKPETAKRARVLTTTNVNLAGYPGMASQPLPSYFGGGGTATPTRTKECKCPPKRKRKPKKPRTVCYSGSYSERANGLRKTKRRKIPCR